MKQGEKTRNKIIEISNRLFYKHGYHETSFSDIVAETGLSKGNITYHFRSKEDILAAVFERRIERTAQTLATWTDEYPTARERLECFVGSLLKGKSELTRFGCPNGTLALELGKNDGVTRDLSRRVFDLIRNWLTEQFLGLGLSADRAKEVAMEFFTRAQGICVLSQVYSDERLFETEIRQLKRLITSR